MIEFTELMRKLIGSSFADGTPCLVGTIMKDGYPQISPKGSMEVFDGETLCYWERSFRSSHSAIVENPNVVVYYRNEARAAEMPYRGAALRFFGRARVGNAQERERAWELTVQAERDRDPEKKGEAVLIRIDRVEDLSGRTLMQRE
jgi:hypothetical protein